MIMPMPCAKARQEMVDERVCRILTALPPRDESRDDEYDLIAAYLADEWACLEVAAVVIAPMFGLEPRDPAVIERLKQAGHAALKDECERIAEEGMTS
jgi:hypothetical protein